MTDYYLKDVHSVLTREKADEVIASLPFAIYRKMGFQHQALELALECDWIEESNTWPAPYPLTGLEHEALEAKRYAMGIINIDASSLKDFTVDVADDGTLTPKLDTSNIGEVTGGTLKRKRPDVSKNLISPASKSNSVEMLPPGHEVKDEPTVVIKSKFAMGSIIKHRLFKAKVIAVGIDMHNGIFYLLSQYTRDGFHRHYVAEDELDGFKVVDNEDLQ